MENASQKIVEHACLVHNAAWRFTINKLVHCTRRLYVTSSEKLLCPVLGLAGVNPLKWTTCLPGARGCRNPYHPSTTACVVPTGDPKIFFTGNIRLNSGEVTLYLSSCCRFTPSTLACKLVVGLFWTLAHSAKSDSVLSVGRSE